MTNVTLAAENIALNAIPPLTASSDALTPNDIALAQALAGGA